MDYIVLDVEATDNGMQEIIEIGAVKVNDKMEVISKFQSFVKPSLNTKLSWYIRRLTKIQQDDIDNADYFLDVYSEFLKWVGEDSLIITWGKADKDFFEKDLLKNEINLDFLEKFVNIQNSVSTILLSKSEVGLTKALEMLDIKQDGEAHRALNDAFNTSQIFIKLFEMLEDISLLSLAIKEVNSIKKSTYKIEQNRYKSYLEKLSIQELKEKSSMLFNVIEKELKRPTINSIVLYAIACQKYQIVKHVLSVKIKKLSLKMEGLKYYQVKSLFDNTNMIFEIKEDLIMTLNSNSKEFYFEIRSVITRLKKAAQKFNKLEHITLKRSTLIQHHKQLINLIDQLNSSLFTQEKYKKELSEIRNRTMKVVKELEITVSSKEAS